jgi:hypothetical protein
MATSNRPTMHQTYIPFVEMYINGVDILRGRDGKPRTLISFTHDIYVGTGGFWTLEVFDPDYISIEEFLVSTVTNVTDIGEKAHGEATVGKDQEFTNISAATFRYGYVGHSVEEAVLLGSGDGETGGYFFGSVHFYIPRFETNGTYLTIRGDSAGTRIRQRPIIYNNYTGMTILEIFDTVCKQQEWKLVLSGGLEFADLEKAFKKDVPGVFGTTDDSSMHTEVEPPQYSKRENEDALDFLNRLCLYARTEGTDFNNVNCRLEYRATKKSDNTAGGIQGYLHLSAETYKKDPIRSYTYMRDPTSDVISYSPNIQAFVPALIGASGMVFKMDSVRKGELGLYTLDEINREKKTFLSERAGGPALTTFSQSESVKPKGRDHTPGVDKPEGVGAGKNRLAGEKTPDQDEELMGMTVSISDDQKGDLQVLNFWLAAQQMVNRASLVIFGDPSEDLVPGEIVWIAVYVPTPEGEMKLHWTSNYWYIVGVNHEIRGGQMLTNLELTRQGIELGGVESDAASAAPAKKTPPGKQRSVGA